VKSARLPAVFTWLQQSVSTFGDLPHGPKVRVVRIPANGAPWQLDHGESYEVCSACGKTRPGVEDDPFSAADDVARRVRTKDSMERIVHAFGDDS
jgi:hypothetical protein